MSRTPGERRKQGRIGAFSSVWILLVVILPVLVIKVGDGDGAGLWMGLAFGSVGLAVGGFFAVRGLMARRRT